ncbi:hypothetical protein M514_27502 [Trichuris suis]|uniref:Uncharacterized protein n=1 Tax=Trichuris suis TaxID=68888 RepID=A0A085MSX9_9BILA|nr:hypothetical protein M514_27502 [Trichuris suis]
MGVSRYGTTSGFTDKCCPNRADLHPLITVNGRVVAYKEGLFYLTKAELALAANNSRVGMFNNRGAVLRLFHGLYRWNGILSMVARAGWCSTVSIISAAAGSISSSPILCALPAFAIINASLYDTSKQSCSILDEVAMIPGNVRRFGIFSCSERKTAEEELNGTHRKRRGRPRTIPPIEAMEKAKNSSARDELGNLDEWPQINGNEPMEMDHEGSTKLKELNGGKLPYMTAYKNTPLPRNDWC